MVTQITSTRFLSILKTHGKSPSVNIQLGLRRVDWLRGLLKGIEIQIGTSPIVFCVWIRLGRKKRRIVGV